MNAHTRTADGGVLKTPSTPWRQALTPLAAALCLAGCTTPKEAGIVPGPLFTQPELRAQSALTRPANAARSDKPATVSDTPQIPDPSRVSTVKPGTPDNSANETANTSLMFDQLPLPNFIQVVFGSILKKNFSVDPAILGKTDLVTLRTAPQTPSQVLETAKMLLKTYGVAVTEMGGFYRIAPDTNLSAYSPEIRRGRAQPEVPLPLRPVFSLVEMTAVRATDVSNWLKAMFGQKLNIQEDGTRNALLLSGQSSDMTAALEAIQVLDQPLMRGRGSRLITPGSLGAEDLARKLIEILSAEGYAATIGAAGPQPISLVPIQASNSLLVFAADPAVLAHVLAWSTKLDTLENDNKRNGNFFSYTVKYADAQALAKTMQELLASGGQAVAPGAIGTAAKPPGRIVVNAATNTLIFTSTQGEYAQLLSIMKELDQPAKSALIEVTVAEIRVTDKNQLGVEWGLPDTTINGFPVTGGTLGGLGQGKDGLTFNFLSRANVVKATLNALASTNKANILSTPRIMARNGESATIQVGQEVPIVTSQQSTNSVAVVAGGTANTPPTGILQTIQYRSTGVILRVKPVIFSGNRIELEVSQEVSTAAETKTGVSTSPTIGTRKIETKLSIRDGATVLLGGLMSSTDTKANTGVPFLKDIPLAGQLFRTNADSIDKTELIVLITPYIIDDDLVADQVTKAVRSQMGAWAGPLPGSEPAAALVKPTNRNLEAPPAPAMAPSLAPAGSEVLPSPNQQEDKSAPKAETLPVPAVAVPPTSQAVPGMGDVPGKTVTDPKLLEELRRANSAPATPAGKPPAAKKKSTP